MLVVWLLWELTRRKVLMARISMHWLHLLERSWVLLAVVLTWMSLVLLLVMVECWRRHKVRVSIVIRWRSTVCEA